MLNYNQIISPALLASYPEYKTENGINYKIDHYEMTENGIGPVYVETNEVSPEQAFNILMGEPI